MPPNQRTKRDAVRATLSEHADDIMAVVATATPREWVVVDIEHDGRYSGVRRFKDAPIGESHADDFQHPTAVSILLDPRRITDADELRAMATSWAINHRARTRA